MDLYNLLAWLIVVTGALAGTFMASRAWKYRQDHVLLLCLLVMSAVKYAVGVIFLLLLLGEPHLQPTTLTLGVYLRPLMPLLLIMPCVLFQLRKI